MAAQKIVWFTWQRNSLGDQEGITSDFRNLGIDRQGFRTSEL